MPSDSQDRLDASRQAPAAGSAAAGYHDERLVAPWWYWVLGVGAAAATGAAIGARMPGWLMLVAVLVAAGGAGGLLVFVSVARVGVHDGAVVGGRARLPAAYAGPVRTVDRGEIRSLLGPGTDPTAHHVVRPWVPDGVVITVTDPDDRTPYWVLSTRKPARMAAAVRAAAHRSHPETDGPAATEGPAAGSAPADRG